MNKDLQTFLDLVDCRPEDVREVPAGRLDVDHSQATPLNVSPEIRLASLGGKEVYFGMHKGKALKDVPMDYLLWACKQKPSNKSFRKFQQNVRDYLRLSDACLASGNHRRGAA